MTSILFVVAIFLLLLVPSAMYGQWWLFSVFFIFGMCFGVIELVCKATTGDTISQKFWKWAVENKKKAWFLLGCMALSWSMLIWHFAEKII